MKCKVCGKEYGPVDDDYLTHEGSCAEGYVACKTKVLDLHAKYYPTTGENCNCVDCRFRREVEALKEKK